MKSDSFMLSKIKSLMEEVEPQAVSSEFGLNPKKTHYEVGTPVSYSDGEFSVLRTYDYKEAHKKFPDLKRLSASIEPTQIVVIGNPDKVHGLLIGHQKSDNQWNYQQFNIPLLL